MMEFSARSVHKTAGTSMRRSVLWAGILALVLVGGLATVAVAQQEIQLVDLPKTDMKSGQITATYDKSVMISGREYAFQPKVVFADDARNPREWKEFKKGDFVQYHLKQERIDFLVLELPK